MITVSLYMYSCTDEWNDNKRMIVIRLRGHDVSVVWNVHIIKLH